MGSLAVTAVIRQLLLATVGSQTSVTLTARVTGTSLWLGGESTFGVALTLVMVGGVVSATVTLDAQAALMLPEESVASHEIAVVPSGNAEPDGGVQAVVTPGQLSAPGAVKVADAPPGPVHSTVTGAGQVTLGFS